METAKIAFNFIFQGGPGPAPDPVNPPYVPGGGGGVATGDALFWTIGILMLISVAAFAFNVLNRKFSLVQGKHIKGNFGQAFNFISQDKVKLVLASISALFVALFLIVAISNISAAYAEENVLMVGNSDEMTITCTVDENGNISIPDTIYKNENQYDASFVSSKVEISNEAKNPEALAAANFNVTGLGGNMFVGKPGESYTIVDSLQKLKAGSETTLSFALSNLSAEEALSLCDTTPFYLYLDYTLDAPMKTATVDLNKGQISIFGHAPEGWVEVDGNYVKDFAVDTQYSNIIAEWNDVDYYYPSMSIVSWDPSEGNLVEDTTFTAYWAFTDWFKPLDWYSWADLSFISDDIAQNYDWFWGSTSPYYPKFREFAENGTTKTFYLTNGDKMAVRIIGINQDFKRNWDRSGLTFTAVHALSAPYSYDTSGYENWAKSDLCQSMNSPTGEIYNLLPWDLKMNMVGVNKQYAKGFDDFRVNFDTDCAIDNEKLFVASATELGALDSDITEGLFYGKEGQRYDYTNCDPYYKFHDSNSNDATTALLTSITYEGYKYIIDHLSDFPNVSSAYSYCFNNGYVVSDILDVNAGQTITRTLVDTGYIEPIDTDNLSNPYSQFGLNFCESYGYDGEFGNDGSSDEMLTSMVAPVVPCFSLGSEPENEYVNIGGNVKISDRPRNNGHSEHMKPGLKVSFTYTEGREIKTVDAYTDWFGNFCLFGVPKNIEGTISFSYMGYHAQTDWWSGFDFYDINLLADGPYLNYYSWDEIKYVSDQINQNILPETLMNEFERYAENGEVKDVPLNHYSNYNDHLYVRIADFKHDIKQDFDSNNKAGITFISVNSINNFYSYYGFSETLSNYVNSSIHSLLQEGGEIYNLFPDDLTKNIVPVLKESVKGWSNGDFVDDWNITKEKLFLPSYTELGGEGEFPEEGSPYYFITNDPFIEYPWHPFNGGPCFSNVNAKGYNWLLENSRTSLVDLRELQEQLMSDWGVPSFIAQGTSENIWTRTLDSDDNDSVAVLPYDADDFDSAHNLSTDTGSVCIAFCIGSDTHGKTTRDISGQIPDIVSHDNKTVNLLYRYNGSITELTSTADSNGYFTFSDIPLFATAEVSYIDNGLEYERKDIYVDNDVNLGTLSLSGPTLNGYTWPQLKVIANSFSSGSVTQEIKTRFEDFAQKGATKKIKLNNPDGEDYLYVRIADFTHDDISVANGEKAGITFIPVNSINKPFNYQNIIEQLTKSTHNWATSDIRESLNNGEIYNMMPQDLLDVVVPVDKKSCEGWSNISIEDFPELEDTTYSAELMITSDKFFIPSYAEIYSTPQEDPANFETTEGSTYLYIGNDPYNEKCKSAGIIEHPNYPFLNALNYIGFEYLMYNADWTKYTSAVDIFSDCHNHLGTITDLIDSDIYNTLGRSVWRWDESFDPMMKIMVLSAPHFAYSGEDEGLMSTSVLGSSVAPCFCL